MAYNIIMSLLHSVSNHCCVLAYTQGPLIIMFLCSFRDGMIKRPGNENYLRKIIEEERKAYCEILDVAGNELAGPETDSETDSES